MPLTDVIRNLNARHRLTRPGLHSATPFLAGQGHVFIHYARLRLESRFTPYIEVDTGGVLGHAASLRAAGLGNGLELDPAAVFALPTDADELIYLDRLVRTLHALNYLTHPGPGNLLLKVHPKHVASVATDHGIAFEEILRPCGLVPAQITLEIETGGIEDHDHFLRAVAGYKSRGYGIAIGRFGAGSVDLGFLAELRPDIVHLDATLLASGRPLHRLIAGVRALGTKIMAASHHLRTLPGGAARAGIDLLQLTEAPIPQDWEFRQRRGALAFPSGDGSASFGDRHGNSRRDDSPGLAHSLQRKSNN